MEKFIEKSITGAVLSVIVVIALASVGLLMAMPIELAWNATMPSVFHLPEISFGQAWCLQFLAGCLVRSITTGSSK